MVLASKLTTIGLLSAAGPLNTPCVLPPGYISGSIPIPSASCSWIEILSPSLLRFEPVYESSDLKVWRGEL